MLNRAYNAVVHFMHALTPLEVSELVAQLPVTVRPELIKELELTGQALRHDGNGQKAYVFEQQGSSVVCWTWNDVRDYDEAGRLLASIVEYKPPMSFDLACLLFASATGRQAR